MFNMILDFCSSLISKKSTFLVVINMSRFEMFLFLGKSKENQQKIINLPFHLTSCTLQFPRKLFV